MKKRKRRERCRQLGIPGAGGSGSAAAWRGKPRVGWPGGSRPGDGGVVCASRKSLVAVCDFRAPLRSPAADAPSRAATGDAVLHAWRGFRPRFARQLVLGRLHHLLCDRRAGGARRAPRPLHQVRRGQRRERLRCRWGAWGLTPGL